MWYAPMNLNKLRSPACIPLLFGIAAIAVQPAAVGQSVVFRGVSVITLDGDGILENQSVVVRDGAIGPIGPASEIDVPPGATIVDGADRYLMPGLADMHVHLEEPDAYISYLAHGVTTVMSLGTPSARAQQIHDEREAIRAGALLAPNVITTARILDGSPPTGGGNTLLSIATAAEAEAVVRELGERQYDFVKIYNNVSREVFDAIVAESKTQRLPVVAHIPRNIDPAYTLRNGIDMVAHSEEFFFTVFRGPRSTSNIDKSYRPDLELIPALVQTLVDADVTVTPNLSYAFGIQYMWDGLDNVWNDPEMAYLAPSTARSWQSGNLNRRDNLENFVYRDALKYSLMQELVRQFHAGGVRMLLGTDAAIEATFPGKSAHRELRELVKAGLTTEEALAIATRNAGDFAREHLTSDERFGRVETGYRADLLLLNANPLTDIRNVSKIAGVMIRGAWLDRSELDERREELARRYGAINEVRQTLTDALDVDRLFDVAADLRSRNPNNQSLVAEIERSVNGLGYDYVSRGDLERAREVFEVNTRLFPGSANVWDSLAETHLALGNRDKSIELYRKALEVDPEFQNARIQLEQILENR